MYYLTDNVDEVSQHKWLLCVQLGGDAAIKAKNVCLQLADDHQFLINHGPLQLFFQPHPQRLVPKHQMLGSPFSLLLAHGEKLDSQEETLLP